MAKKNKLYERLPGKGKSLFGYSTLWLGPDHLLAIDSRVFVEDYKRFYFKDIQAIVCRKTAVRDAWTAVLGLLFLLFFLPAIFSDIDPTGFWIMAGLFLVFFLINIGRGPTCVCHIQTAVQTEKLASLNRLKNVEKGLKRLQPRIDEAQGTLSPEAMETFSEIRTDARGREKRPVFRASSAEKPVRHEKGRVHLALFLLLLVDLLFAILPFFHRHPVLSLLAGLATVGTSVCLIIALVKQRGSDISSALRAVTWTGLGYFCITYIIGYVILFFVIFKNPQIAGNQWEIIKMVSEISPHDNAYILAIHLFNICGSGILGITGLILLKRFQHAYETARQRGTASSASAVPAAGSS